MCQEQLLLYAIHISVSDSIAPLITSTTASQEAWDKLTRLYASRSRSRVMSLKECLVRPRDSSSLNEYLCSIKTIANELALIDTPVSDYDITIAILNGVGHKFKELTTGIHAWEHHISYEELHDKLIDYEAYLKREDLGSTSSVLSANTTQRYNSHRGHQSTWASNRKAVLPHHFHPQSSWSTSRQFSSTQQVSPWQTNRNNYQRRGYRGVCQFCDQQGYSAKQCTRAKGLLGPSPTAHCTTTNTAPRQPWLLDSAATNHVTSDLHNLSLHSIYDGPDSILIGDGTGLCISHSGSTTLSPFIISNVLCVPSIQKNLVSVSQFCKQHLTSIEFFPSYFFVKDLRTGQTLLQGPNKNDIYEWPLTVPVQPSAMVGVKTSVNEWQKRLGHPSSRTLQSLLQKFSLPVSSKNICLTLCSSCQCNKSHKLPFTMSSLTSNGPLEIIFIDVWGPASVESIDQNKYFVIFVDHFT
jgi:hypothetical protein